ncbi:LysR substrate-binding domain-containing protein [Vulcanococcus sp.]|uniref:LysR substrate-binding domain-containing protein n=1 Tax=Vulcanococcus sp. TaxID=2856995 RepID=UPI003C027F62
MACTLTALMERDTAVVVSVEQLNAFDLLVWLRTGERAAERLGCSQSTVSRAAAQVANIFGLELHRVGGEWSFSGDSHLLNCQREVHRHYRWQRHQPLRIEAQYCNGPLLLDPAPEGWICGGFDFLEIHSPLQLLRDGVIDAWLGVSPDVPDDDPDFAVVHLTRQPTLLTVPPGHPLLQRGSALSLQDLQAFPSLALPDGAFPKMEAHLKAAGLWSGPSRAPRYQVSKWEGLALEQFMVGYATAYTLKLFPLPNAVLPLDVGLMVGDALVVRQDDQAQPRVAALVELLHQRALALQAEMPALEVLL